MANISWIWRFAVSTPSLHQTLTIKIDTALATEYRDTYCLALGSHNEIKQTLDEFIARFVEDRLAEEIAFFEAEIASDSR